MDQDATMQYILIFLNKDFNLNSAADKIMHQFTTKSIKNTSNAIISRHLKVKLKRFWSILIKFMRIFAFCRYTELMSVYDYYYLFRLLLFYREGFELI